MMLFMGIIYLGALCSLFTAAGAVPPQGVRSVVEITVTDASTGKKVLCRIHLMDSRKQPVKAPGLPFFRDHFVCPGKVELALSPGEYRYEVERGPEYTRRSGRFTAGESKTSLRVELERLADLARRGWWSGELHVHRPPEDLKLLMAAEDLHVAPVITWWNNRNHWTEHEVPEQLLVQFDGTRFSHLMAGEDEREGGALLYFNLDRALEIQGSSREHPSPMKFLAEARDHPGVHVDIEKPFWWDVPVWLASGQVDTIGLANNHMCRDRMFPGEAWGKPRDTDRLPPPRGNGFWTQEIYYQIQNCGLRIPPSAGSASGVLRNPVGYNRVYVKVEGKLTHEKWWEALRAGRSFVTNGPLLLIQANDKTPGEIFTRGDGEQLELDLRGELTAEDPVVVVEIIKNGRLERAVPVEEFQAKGSLGRLTFHESGWFLVRCITDRQDTFRFASTAPFYVEIGEQKRRISKASVKFFLDWVEERKNRIQLDDPAEHREVVSHHEAAREFWEKLLEQANAE